MHIIASKPSNSFLCQEHELVNMKTTLFLVYAMCSFQGSVLAQRQCQILEDSQINDECTCCVPQGADLIIWKGYDMDSILYTTMITGTWTKNIVQLQDYGLYICGVREMSGCALPFMHDQMRCNISRNNMIKFECILGPINMCSDNKNDMCNGSEKKRTLKLHVSCCSTEDITVTVTTSSSESPSSSNTVSTATNPACNQDGGDSCSTDSPKGSPTTAIVASVFGVLIVLILAALLSLQVVRMLRKKRKQHHTIHVAGDNNNTENALYTRRDPLPPEPSSYKSTAVNGHLQQPSPYEYALNGLGSAQPSPYECAPVNISFDVDSEQSNDDQSLNGCGTEANHYAEQHVYEDADRYFKCPEDVVSNAEYDAPVKCTKEKPSKKYPAGSKNHVQPDDKTTSRMTGVVQTQPQPRTIDDSQCLVNPIYNVKEVKSPTSRSPANEEDYAEPNDAITQPQPSSMSVDDGECLVNPVYDVEKKVRETKSPQTQTSRNDIRDLTTAVSGSAELEPVVSATSSTPDPHIYAVLEPPGDNHTTSCSDTEHTSPPDDEIKTDHGNN